MPRQNAHYCNRHRVASLLFSCALIRFKITIEKIKLKTHNIKLSNRALVNRPEIANIENVEQKNCIRKF